MVKEIKGIKVDYNLIDNQHQDSFWYGGCCAEFNYEGYTILIEANGDMIATLFDEKENELAYCKDKNNGGTFYWEMGQYIKNDKELTKAISGGRLIIDYNNWWEVFVIDKDGKWYDLMWDLDNGYLMDAIEETIDNVDKIIGCVKGEKQFSLKNS